MIIVHITGGLGNQMSQYCLYREYLAQGKDAYADISWYSQQLSADEKVDARKFELPLLGLDVKKCPSKYENWGANKAGRYVKRLFVGKTYLEKGYAFTPELMDVKRGFVTGGCFLGEQYIPDCKDEIRKEMVFSGTDDAYVKEMEEKITNCNAVSIHMRLGDYLNLQGLYGNICTDNYYKNAIKHIKENVENPVFFLFSNDTKLASQMLDGEQFVVVDGNTGDKSHLDMYLMSKCKHNIIANSTFSWWGAWLNSNENKIVCCPNTLLNGYNNGSVYPHEWRRIDS